MQNNEENRLAVSVVEAARMIGVSRRSVEGYIGAGLLESRKLGSRRIVLVRDLLRFLRSDKPSASPSNPSKRRSSAEEENSGIGSSSGGAS
jgi:hypothetical protein